jgi:hypothetical protein
MKRVDPCCSFCSRIPAEHPDVSEPKGLLVAERVMSALREQGLVDLKLENWRDVGYSVDCTIDGWSVYCVLSHLGDGEREWILCCTSDIGAVGRLFGRNDESARKKLAKAVDEALHADADFSQVRWYTISGWHGNRDDPWQEHP